MTDYLSHTGPRNLQAQITAFQVAIHICHESPMGCNMYIRTLQTSAHAYK